MDRSDFPLELKTMTSQICIPSLLIISIFVSIIISLYTFAGGAGVRSVNNEFTFIVWNFFLGGWPTLSYVYLRKKINYSN